MSKYIYYMNWFDKIQLVNLLKLTKGDLPMIKTAALVDNGDTTYDWKNQMGSTLWFGDVNRYVMDSYTVKVYLSKTQENITISLMTNHSYLGTAQYCVFWAFDHDEEKQAIEVYKKLNKEVKKIVKDFVDKQKPTSLFDPALRGRVQLIDDPHLVRTNIPVINYSYNIDYEPDWDRNIYGPRYPTYKEVSFKQYLNNSIYSDKKNAPTGKFAL